MHCFEEPALLLHNLMISAQSDQSFRCPHEESLGLYLPIERTPNTLIRLGGCPGWSESSLGAKILSLVLSWGGSYTLDVHLLLNKNARVEKIYFVKYPLNYPDLSILPLL